MADDGVTGASEILFRSSGYVRRQTGEHYIAVQRRLRRLHHHRFDEGGHVADQPPGTGFAIRLSLRTVRRGQRGDLKLRVVRQQLNETLADHAGRAQNPNSYTMTRRFTQNRPSPRNHELDVAKQDPKVQHADCRKVPSVALIRLPQSPRSIRRPATMATLAATHDASCPNGSPANGLVLWSSRARKSLSRELPPQSPQLASHRPAQRCDFPACRSRTWCPRIQACR